MPEQKDILESLAGQRITAVRMGQILGVTEKTARNRLADGLNSDDVISICRAYGINPVSALTELKKLTLDEVYDFLDSDGQLLATASQDELIVALADTSLTTGQLAELIANRSRPTPRAADDSTHLEITQADLALAAGHNTLIDDSDDHDDYA